MIDDTPCVSFSFYHKDTGFIHSFSMLTTNPQNVAINTPSDHIAIGGYHDPLSKKVDIATGAIVDYQPPAPSSNHEWNADAKRWQLTAAVQATNDKRAVARSRIAQLEASQHRAVRELALGTSGALQRLQAIDSEIAALRADL
jgi:hypothetical protein